MTRRCSHCCNNGHNSRTCPNRGVKLFGVRLTDGSIRKSASMGTLSNYAGSGLSSGFSSGSMNPGSPAGMLELDAGADGYASEDFVPSSSSSYREKKKGVPWTEEEHRMFLVGLKKLGKGDWRGIARNFVISRTPTQVASHAQKYFIRQTNNSRRKRRSSLLDIVSDQLEPEIISTSPSPDEERESMDSTSFPALFSSSISPHFPVSGQIWSGNSSEIHGVFKPKAIYSKSPIKVDELVGMSKLSLGESLAHSGSSSRSLNLRQRSSRQSAFHANPSSESTNMKSGGSPIHAV